MKKFLAILTAGLSMEPAVQGNIWDFLERIVNYFLYFTALFVAPLLYILAAIYFFTAAGETEKIDKTKKLIFWTSAGLFIILLAKGLISYLNTLF